MKKEEKLYGKLCETFVVLSQPSRVCRSVSSLSISFGRKEEKKEKGKNEVKRTNGRKRDGGKRSKLKRKEIN